MVSSKTRGKRSLAEEKPQTYEGGLRVRLPTILDLWWLVLGAVFTNAIRILMETWLSIVPLLSMEILTWAYVVTHIPQLITRLRRMAHVLFFLIVVLTASYYVEKSPNILGSANLRGLVSGIDVPLSDFSWATNGRVRASRSDCGGGSMRIDISLRGDKPYGDAGWGMDLLRFNYLKLKLDYNASFASIECVEFDILGENGGENVGISMKSDREPPSASGAWSDEEKVPLRSLDAKNWRHECIPLVRFANFNKLRARNVAFYTDRSLRNNPNSDIIFYVKNIAFGPARPD